MKIKTNMTFVYEVWSWQIMLSKKMLHEQWLQLKMKLLLGYNMKIVI